MENLEHIVYSREVLEFTAVASEYCSMLENEMKINGVKFLKVQQKILPLLYYKTLMIPSFEPVLPDEELEKFVTESEWSMIENRVISMLGEANDYLAVPSDLSSVDDGMVSGSIGENLADIYQDLKDFLVAYNVGTIEIMNDALWQCLENFRLYWGEKLVNVIKAVHYALLDPDKIGVSEKENDLKTPGGPDTSDWFITKRQKEFRERGDDEI